jgi:hypothetical protein
VSGIERAISWLVVRQADPYLIIKTQIIFRASIEFSQLTLMGQWRMFRKIPRKILESAHIGANRERFLNLNEGIGVTGVYGKGNWLRRGI